MEDMFNNDRESHRASNANTLKDILGKDVSGFGKRPGALSNVLMERVHDEIKPTDTLLSPKDSESRGQNKPAHGIQV